MRTRHINMYILITHNDISNRSQALVTLQWQLLFIISYLYYNRYRYNYSYISVYVYISVALNALFKDRLCITQYVMYST